MAVSEVELKEIAKVAANCVFDNIIQERPDDLSGKAHSVPIKTLRIRTRNCLLEVLITHPYNLSLEEAMSIVEELDMDEIIMNI